MNRRINRHAFGGTQRERGDDEWTEMFNAGEGRRGFHRPSRATREPDVGQNEGHSHIARSALSTSHIVEVEDRGGGRGRARDDGSGG